MHDEFDDATALVINNELDAEAKAIALPADHQPHAFVGRGDRWCEVCNWPDRNPIHIIPEPTALVIFGVNLL